jgi:hypothetical protein
VARLVFDVDGRSTKAPETSGYPLLVCISGATADVSRLSRRATGPVDVRPIDFTSWAIGFVPAIRAGLDPLEIEAAMSAGLAQAGIASRDTRTRNAAGASGGCVAAHRFDRNDLLPLVGSATSVHRHCLPKTVIDPALSKDARRETFLRMIEACLEEQPNIRIPAGHGCERTTEFSLPGLLPLQPVETLPLWSRRHDPFRNEAKRQAWGTSEGGLEYARISVGRDGCLITAGVFNRACRGNRNYLIAFAAIARAYDVTIEVTTWGELTRIRRDGSVRQRRDQPGTIIGAALARYGVRSADHLAALFAIGQYEKALHCLHVIRRRLLHPPICERIAEATLAAAATGAMALGGAFGGRLPTADEAGTARWDGWRYDAHRPAPRASAFATEAAPWTYPPVSPSTALRDPERI